MCAREGHPTEGPEARRARSTFDASLSEATKRGQRLTRTDAGVRLRSKETIEAASKARQRWQTHLDGTEGPNEVLTEVLHCWLLEAPLESWPEAWTLIEGERVLTWDGFDLSKALSRGPAASAGSVSARMPRTWRTCCMPPAPWMRWP